MVKYTKKDIVISAIVLMLVVVVATLLGILKTLNVIEAEVSFFVIIMAGLTLGFGVYITAFGIFKKGGYELAVGGILSSIGVSLTLVCFSVHYAIVIAVGVALVLMTIISLVLLKAPKVVFVPTDEEEGFVPYMEKLKNEKEQEKANEEALPEIKSFK